MLKVACLGRKNYLFAGSPAGGERLAIGYTLVASARMHGVDPQAYLANVLGKLGWGWRKIRLRELLPDRWVKGEAEKPS